MQLGDLLKKLSYPESLSFSSSCQNLTIKDVADDSRMVKEGYAFVAVSGAAAEGGDFIPDVIKKGAIVIVCDEKSCKKYSDTYPQVCFVQVKSPRLFLSYLAATMYPEQPETIIAVTGTNGKTSVVNFVRQLWESLGYASASLGTLGVQSKHFQAPKHLTTPDPLYLHKMLQEMHRKGITHLAMEASSHGIDQYRLERVHLQAAGFTNLSPDHLDYHGTLGKYLEAKSALFKRILSGNGVEVLNADIPEFSYLKEESAGHKILSYGYKGEDIVLESLIPMSDAQILKIRLFKQPFTIQLPLPGEFQAYNALCALGLVLSTVDCQPNVLIKAMEKLKGIPGRIECAGKHPNGAAIYVDYAHASGGMETLLKAMRPHVKGSLWIVFGAGGGRDPSTRPLMGAVADKYADHVIITDDNPRYENPDLIRRQILQKCPIGKEISDRKEAITYAIKHLKPDDLLLVTGKGPEDGQIIQGITYPFLDRAVIQEILEEL